ncbi:MAG: hypothetical protein ABJG41_03720 [Cyclobacteriaceae bacterium]
MNFSEEQMTKLKRVFGDVKVLNEGGVGYIYIPNLHLPEGCKPELVDVLFCPTARDGYSSRLFLSERITGCPTRNWNSNVRILDRTWHAVSWRIPDEQQLYETIMYHLNAFDTDVAA